MSIYDIAIIGGGAAGLAAAAEACGAGRSVVVIDRMGGGGELMNLGTLVDYPDAATGPDAFAHLMEQAADAVHEIAEVTSLVPTADGWTVGTDTGTHAAAAIILAVGLAPGTLGLPNEADFEGMGISHCAVCDGPLYGGQPVVVAGADRWAVHEALELLTFGAHVTVVAPEPPAARGFSTVAGRIAGLKGENGLDTVVVDVSGPTAVELPAQAVFLQTGRIPSLGFVGVNVALDADGRVVSGSTGETDTPRLFAAGDVRSGSPRTLAAAISDGRAAARAAMG